jgi:hypothetical protein
MYFFPLPNGQNSKFFTSKMKGFIEKLKELVNNAIGTSEIYLKNHNPNPNDDEMKKSSKISP